MCPDQIGVADISYLRTDEGWLYLTGVTAASAAAWSGWGTPRTECIRRLKLDSRQRPRLAVFGFESGFEGAEPALLIRSRIDKRSGLIDGLRPTVRFELQLVPADDSRERRYTRRLDT